MSNLKKIWSYQKGKWGLGILLFFILIAFFADIIANEKPLFCKYEGQSYFPVLHEYGESLGILKQYDFLARKTWDDLEVESALFPIIKFSASQIDRNSSAFSPPGAIVQNSKNGLAKKHWLGSDAIGRDVAAGIIQGTRMTFAIALFAMLIATVIGFFFGILSGFYGDNTVRVNVWILIALVVMLSIIWFQWFYGHWSFGFSALLSFVFAVMFSLLSTRVGGKEVYLPLDIIVERMIEVFKSVPALFILLALLTIISKPSVLSLIVIIGLLRWTTIARVLRAELLNLKEKKFVLSAKAIGASRGQIILRHLLPNALPSLLTIIAFGFAGTILLEATISFLGLGLSAEIVTWGSILSEARNNFSAWWLAVFPGLAIFLMVIACNYLGDTFNEISLESS